METREPMSSGSLWKSIQFLIEPDPYRKSSHCCSALSCRWSGDRMMRIDRRWPAFYKRPTSASLVCSDRASYWLSRWRRRFAFRGWRRWKCRPLHRNISCFSSITMFHTDDCQRLIFLSIFFFLQFIETVSRWKHIAWKFIWFQDVFLLFRWPFSGRASDVVHFVNT